MSTRRGKLRRTAVAQQALVGLTELADAMETTTSLGTRFRFHRVRLDLEAGTYGPAEVKATRNLVESSQTVFAKLLGVSVKTVRAWEQGLKPPSPMACRFMDEIRDNKESFLRRLLLATRSD